MAATDDGSPSLRELHDHYVWEVNAAIGEGRADLVTELSDEFLREAMTVMAGGATICSRPDCSICRNGPGSLPPTSDTPGRAGWPPARRRSWTRRSRR